MIIAFAGVHGLGQTFMDWSFNYLAGKDSYWHYQKGMMPLVNDPTTNQNAHGHDKNHPVGLEATKEFLIKAKQAGIDNTTFYPYIDGLSAGPETLRLEEQLYELLSKEDVKTFTINLTKPYPYFFMRNGANKDQVLDLLQSWLKSDSVAFKENDFGSIREAMAFKIIGNRRKWLESLDKFYHKINPTVERYFTDEDWVAKTEDCLRTIFDDLSIKIDNTRLDGWRDIRSKWVTFHERVKKWYEIDIPNITRNIIENKSMDLDQFDMDIREEATVMAHLMKDYGRRLRLPTDYFPKDTKELHRLLK